MRAIVDKDACIGCGLCIATEPDVFQMDDDGKAVAIEADVSKDHEDEAKDAEASCPVSAISVS